MPVNKFHTLKSSELITGDSLDVLADLPKDHFSLIVSSPPYNIRKPYERGDRLSLTKYIKWQDQIVGLLVDRLTHQGSVCWQTGNYVEAGEVFPLDMMFYDMFKRRGLKLRNRIVWRFNFGLNADRRFSGRYETMLWFTKSDDYTFNLDPVRIPQLYPGKRHGKSKGARAGLPSGNPKGKNPSDCWEFSAEKDFKENPIWEIPNVKANHPEKTDHPCQFPIELAERCVLALTKEGEAVLDPFVGSGASIIAAIKHDRRAVGIDKDNDFINISRQRVVMLLEGKLPMREPGKPVRQPNERQKVAQIPQEWQIPVKGRQKVA